MKFFGFIIAVTLTVYQSAALANHCAGVWNHEGWQIQEKKQKVQVYYKDKQVPLLLEGIFDISSFVESVIEFNQSYPVTQKGPTAFAVAKSWTDAPHNKLLKITFHPKLEMSHIVEFGRTVELPILINTQSVATLKQNSMFYFMHGPSVKNPQKNNLLIFDSEGMLLSYVETSHNLKDLQLYDHGSQTVLKNTEIEIEWDHQTLTYVVTDLK